MEYAKDSTKSGRFGEMVDSKTLDFFTIMADIDGEPRTTLQLHAEEQQGPMRFERLGP